MSRSRQPWPRFAPIYVVRQGDGQVVFSNSVTGPRLNQDTDEQLYTADFSAFHESGAFQLDVPGVGRSAPFRIGRDIHNDPFTP